MELLVDFGNTRVKAAVADGDVLRVVYSGPIEPDGIRMSVNGLEINGGMWCAVHPLPAAIESWMRSIGMTPLSASTPVPLHNSYSTPQTLGMDRLAAAVGAWSMKPGHDILVIDAGTAITFDFITSDGEYKGGNIAPGIGLRLRSLHDYTGALPLVQTKGPAPSLGKDTETAIRSGVLRGIRHEAEGYIRDIETQYPSLLVFLTGGDAEFFDIKAKSSIFAVPDLVLRGLARIVEYNEK